MIEYTGMCVYTFSLLEVHFVTLIGIHFNVVILLSDYDIILNIILC